MRPSVVRTTAAGNSRVLPLDFYGRPQVSIQLVMTGGATATVQQTLDDPQVPGATLNWINHADAAMVGAAGPVQGNYAYLPRALRVVQAGAGTVTMTVLQAGTD